jgi:LAO/AO transport system kinase
VITCSALTDHGVDDVWEQVVKHRSALGDPGLAQKRSRQLLEFSWLLVRDELNHRLEHSSAVAAVRAELQARILAGEISAIEAADLILAAYDS